MTTEPCAAMAFLLQADADGELAVGEAANLAAHLMQCSACRGRQAALQRLSGQLRAELPYHVAPARLRRAVVAQVREPLRRGARAWVRLAFPAGLGAAFAGAALLALLPPSRDKMAESVVASHIRALQPGHLMDVISTDRHTVKPWFDGRLDYAPPVKDLASQGFPLTGGRLDYLGGRPVAALDYRRAKHDIDFYAWPSAGAPLASDSTGILNGYNYIEWSQDNMVFWVVSDLNASELHDFVTLWRASK